MHNARSMKLGSYDCSLLDNQIVKFAKNAADLRFAWFAIGSRVFDVDTSEWLYIYTEFIQILIFAVLNVSFIVRIIWFKLKIFAIYVIIRQK
jgi:hypothetical protein